MESKAPASSLCLFKETCTDLQSSASSVVKIQLPSSSPFSARSRQQQRLLKQAPTYEDEDTFSKYCLATSASIHFSRQSSYPRSILWRVLQDQKVLELRSVDLSKSERETKEAYLTIQLHFPVPIRHGGVALADSEDPNLLNVFALTKGNELYTSTVLRSIFWIRAASEEDVGAWCRIYKPATFSMSTPFHLIAGGPLQLVVSLTDGRLLQLKRDKQDDGSRWVETVYGDGQWGSSLRGLVRWQGSNTVRYDGATLEQNTPITMAVSPDNKHIFAVCLNHTLRVWNPNKAASVYSGDLLCQHREPYDIPKVMLDPANAKMLQLFQATSGSNGDLYYAITFSPHDFGQFKFWGIRDPDHGEAGIRDLFPDDTFKAPDPDPSPDSKAIWKVADFKVKSERDDQGLEMWILMRSHRRYKLYRLTFDLQGLDSQWQDCWCVAASESVEHRQLPYPSDLDPEDVTEKWLEYLLRPGRYPDAVLETALAIYRGDQTAPANTKAPLKERMYSAIASRVSTDSRSLVFEDYRTATHREWTTLHQDIQDLNKSRWEVLSLAYDNATGMPTIIFTDANAAVRSCSRAEIISQNSPTDLAKSTHLLETPSVETENGEEPSLPDELAVLIEAAAKFRSDFSYRLQLAFTTTLASELWLDPLYSVPLRIQAFYDQCNFAEDISAEQFSQLARQLEAIGGFDSLDVVSFKAIMDTFAHDFTDASSGMLYTNQGLKLLINGASEMIGLHARVLQDMLALVTVVEMEIDREEFRMENFDGPRIYTALLDLLKRYQVMQWLVTNVRMDKSLSHGRPSQSKELQGKLAYGHNSSVTILESMFAHDLKPQSTGTQSQSEALTQNVQDLLQWVVGGNTQIDFEDVPVYIQCDLLKNGDLDLATDFFGFQPSTSWSTYIKGRYFLLMDKPTEAAINFKRAAFKLSRPSELDATGASSGLLSATEAVHFGHGLPTYYTHIIDLFQSSHPTQTAQFARLALQLGPPAPSNPEDQNITTALLESLFHASLATTDISTAYNALTRHPSPHFSLLPTFIQTLFITSTSLPQLLSLPFPSSFHTPIDALLAQQNKPKILAAWRMHHNDFRGAAAALLPDLQQAQAQSQHRIKRSAERELDEIYLSVINLLACAGRDEGWVLHGGSASGIAGDGIGGVGKPEGAKRKVVTLQDVRAGYQRELDRRSVIQSGRYDFGGGSGEAMDVS